MIEQRLSRLLGARVRSLRRIEGRGYSVAYRAVAELDDGRSVFVKAGTEELTNHLLCVEQRFYRELDGPFLPRLVACDEDEPPITNAGGFAALLAGFFGCRAGLPPPATAPHVRSLQQAQLGVALPWAARELGLEPPG